jgi:hypothetical protein
MGGGVGLGITHAGSPPFHSSSSAQAIPEPHEEDMDILLDDHGVSALRHLSSSFSTSTLDLVRKKDRASFLRHFRKETQDRKQKSSAPAGGYDSRPSEVSTSTAAPKRRSFSGKSVGESSRMSSERYSAIDRSFTFGLPLASPPPPTLSQKDLSARPNEHSKSEVTLQRRSHGDLDWSSELQLPAFPATRVDLINGQTWVFSLRAMFCKV